MGPICTAVRAATLDDAGDLWACYCRHGAAFRLDELRSLPDGFDSRIFHQLALGEPCARAGMRFAERKDGSLRPWLLIREERRISASTMVGGRRITDPQEAS